MKKRNWIGSNLKKIRLLNGLSQEQLIAQLNLLGLDLDRTSLSRIENQNNQFTKVVLFAKVPFNITTKEDRIRTCYMQACLAYVNFSAISNADIREIFGLSDKDKVKISRVIKDTIEKGLIKPLDPNTAPRYMKYIPYWA